MRYKMEVFEVYSDCWKLTDTKRFRSIWLAKAYRLAIHKRYEGDSFKFRIYKIEG